LKKGAFIIIGFIIIGFITGHFFIYKLALYSHKTDFRNYLKKHSEKAETIEIPSVQLYMNTKQIEWCDNNNEIRYNNDLYDVLSVKQENGKAILKVVSDKAEEQMAENYDELSNIIFAKNKCKSTGHHLSNSFLSLKCIITNPVSIDQYITSYNYSVAELTTVCSVYLPVQTLPPIV